MLHRIMSKVSVHGLLAMSILSAGSVCAETLTWVKGATDLSSPESYSPARLPQKGDVLRVIDGGVTLTVDDGSLATFSLFENVKLNEGSGKETVIVVNVSANAELGCWINKVDSTSWEPTCGTFVKRGAGTLTLRDTTESKSHYTAFKVEEGVLELPRSIQRYQHFYCGDMTVDAGATLALPMAGNLRCQRLFGAGVVSNSVAGTQIQPTYEGPEPGVFSGRFVGSLSYFANAHQYLTGTETAIAGNARPFGYNGGYAGILGFSNLGMKGKPSSLGKGPELGFYADGPCCYLYLGSGETSDKGLTFRPKANYLQPETLDAGATGGLVLAGDWKHESGDSQMRLVLTGSNAVPCRILGKFTGLSQDGTNYSWHVTKRGTGTWSFESADASGLRGPLAVEDGTVSFTTLNEKGVNCSLGLSTELWADAYGPQTTPVDYAFLLGSGEAVGTMSHIGTDAVICTTRPIQVKGKGGRVSADGAALKLGGFSAASAGDTTLTLAGTNGAANNTAWSVSDGAGRVSVVKEGANTWTIDGEQAFSGDLTVREGTLVVRNASGRPHSWIRFIVKETAQTCPRYAGQVPGGYSGRIQFAKMTLLDGEGRRQLVGAPLAADDRDIPAGSVGYGHDRARPRAGIPAEHVNGAFSDSRWTSLSCPDPSRDRPETWLQCVFHLAEGTPEIKAFNFVMRWGTGSDYWASTPTAFAIEGSSDGLHWTELYAADAWDVPAGNDAWATGSANAPIPFARPAVAGTVACLESVGAVRVAAGATLRNEGAETTLSKLCIDANGAGTIDGFTFAKDGMLSVTNLPYGDCVALPGKFENVKGLENLADWSLSISGGRNSSAYTVAVKDGRVFVNRRGLTVIMR